MSDILINFSSISCGLDPWQRKLKFKDQAFFPKVVSVDNEINRCRLALFHTKVSNSDREIIILYFPEEAMVNICSIKYESKPRTAEVGVTLYFSVFFYPPPNSLNMLP